LEKWSQQYQVGVIHYTSCHYPHGFLQSNRLQRRDSAGTSFVVYNAILACSNALPVQKHQVPSMGLRRPIQYKVSGGFMIPLDSFLPSFIRPYWRCYFPNTSAIIYVIDSSDQARLSTSRTELLTMLSEEELKGVPLLVFCNKQDMEGALKPEVISEELGLAGGEKTRPWSVRGSCATKGEGLEEGLDWYVWFCCPLFPH